VIGKHWQLNEDNCRERIMWQSDPAEWIIESKTMKNNGERRSRKIFIIKANLSQKDCYS
jgi:hypothetical protein